MEPHAERPEAREADQEADLGDGQVGGPQEGLRALDPAPGQVGAGRLTVGRRERTCEVEPGIAGLGGHRLEVERLREIAVDQVARPPERGQEEQRVLGRDGHSPRTLRVRLATRAGRDRLAGGPFPVRFLPGGDPRAVAEDLLHGHRPFADGRGDALDRS